jgi:hypothetical protein
MEGRFCTDIVLKKRGMFFFFYIYIFSMEICILNIGDVFASHFDKVYLPYLGDIFIMYSKTVNHGHNKTLKSTNKVIYLLI